VLDKNKVVQDKQQTSSFTLITNLNVNIYDEKVKSLYNNRWYIEVFFKIFKNNFKFEHMLEKKKSIIKKYLLWGDYCLYRKNNKRMCISKYKTKYNYK